jgi:CheY-like chemotaxis protein
MSRILLVDDDGLVRKSVHRTLVRAGHEVWESAGPKTALRILEAVPVDLVITDYFMPGMNGVELIRQTRGDHQPRIIAMTGGGYTRSAAEVLSEARCAGADLTLEKPFGPGALLAAVQQVLTAPVAA